MTTVNEEIEKYREHERINQSSGVRITLALGKIDDSVIDHNRILRERTELLEQALSDVVAERTEVDQVSEFSATVYGNLFSRSADALRRLSSSLPHKNLITILEFENPIPKTLPNLAGALSNAYDGMKGVYIGRPNKPIILSPEKNRITIPCSAGVQLALTDDKTRWKLQPFDKPSIVAREVVPSIHLEYEFTQPGESYTVLKDRVFTNDLRASFVKAGQDTLYGTIEKVLF